MTGHNPAGTVSVWYDYAALIISGVAVTALAVYLTLLGQTGSQSVKKADTHVRPKDEAATPSVSKQKQLLRLVRHCEHLSTVEDELIRRVCNSGVDRPTGQLIAQMQICTRRLQKQLEELR